MTTCLQVKQNQAQQTRQALSVMECIVECGVAAICQNRGLFPPSFFVSRDTGSTTVTTFNMDVLCGGDDATLSDQESHIAPHHHDSPSFALKNPSETSESSCDSPNSEISPLTTTSTTCATSIAGGGSQCSSTLGDSIPSSDNERITSTQSGNDQAIRAEALLLLHWIRKGVFQILKEGKLSRLIFGICIPAQEFKDFRHLATDNNKKKFHNSTEPHATDELLESYVFDLSQLQPHDVTKGSCCINKNKVNNAFTALFRNLDSFSSVQTKVKMIQFPRIGRNPIANMVELPLSNRYFTVRIELIDDQLPLTLLPKSIDPAHFLSRQVDTSIISKRTIPSIEKSLSALSPTPLGKIMEDNVTGLSLCLTAFCANIDNAPDELIKNNKKIKTKETRNRRRKKRQVIQGAKKRIPQSVLDPSQNCASSTPSSFGDELVLLPILADSTMAFAIPYTSAIRKKRKSVCKNKGSYIPCTILDNRISRKNRKMDYKVIFFNDDLRQKNIQKQWISCEKVISKESMMHNIQTILKTENSYFRDPHGLESLARKMKVGLNTILEAVCVMKNHHNTDELTSSMNSPDSEVRRKKRKNRTEEKKSRRFSFAMSPIQGIIN